MAARKKVDAKRKTITFRVSDHFHADLLTCAKRNGTSLSQEIERRLLDTLRLDHIQTVIRDEVRAAFYEGTAA